MNLTHGNRQRIAVYNPLDRITVYLLGGKLLQLEVRLPDIDFSAFSHISISFRGDNFRCFNSLLMKWVLSFFSSLFNGRVGDSSSDCENNLPCLNAGDVELSIIVFLGLEGVDEAMG